VLSRRDMSATVGALMERFTPGPNRAVIVWKNTTRCLLNRMLRGRDGEPQPGDRVVMLKGDALPELHRPPTGVGGGAVEWASAHRLTYVHNGELGTVAAVLKRDQKTITLVVKLDDPDPENGVTRPHVRTTAALHQFGEPTSLALNDQRRPVGRGWQSWDYGYALTAHKAQGSEFEEVVVIDEIPSSMSDASRWRYTAITRAAKRLVIVQW
jgi:ATP-dependent exoDNAse (exonuclease V) alpha subunit